MAQGLWFWFPLRAGHLWYLQVSFYYDRLESHHIAIMKYMDNRPFHRNQFSYYHHYPENFWIPFFLSSQWPLSPQPSSPWSPPGHGTTTRTWTSSPTETRALLPSSQVKTENLNLHKLNLEIIVKAYKTYNTLLMLIIDHPGTQSPIHHTNFMYALDDSLDTFMHQTKAKK